GEAQELPLHRRDPGEIGRDVVVAATLAGGQLEAAAREFLGRASAAEMDDGGEVLLLPRARGRAGSAGEDRRDVAVEEHRGELDGVARRHAEAEAAQPAGAPFARDAALDDNVAADAIAPRLREGGVGHLVHA